MGREEAVGGMRDHRAWWASLTERQRRLHNLKSALGINKQLVRSLEAAYDQHILSATMLLDLLGQIEPSLLLMENSGDLSLRLLSDVRATRERVTRLRLRAQSGPVEEVRQ